MKININSIAELPEAAAVFLKAVGEHKIIAFSAKMGAGKTTFIKALLKALGINEVVTSPTYSIVNEYDSKKFGRIYHFDLYRIKDDQEALDVGIEEMLYSGNFCFIEWPEKINNLLPDNVIWSYIRRNEDSTRTLTIEI